MIKSCSAAVYVVDVVVVVVLVFGTNILDHRSEVNLLYILLVIVWSALIIISITYPLSSRLNGFSICVITHFVLSACKCFSYRLFPQLYVSPNIALDNVVPKIALFT